MEPCIGLEPMTLRLTAACSTDWANRAYWRPEGDSNPWPLAWQASVLTDWTTRPYMWEYHHPLWQRPPMCCLSDFRENKASRIYLPKIHTKLPLCLERLVSCIHYIRQVLPPKETVSTLSRSANISWLFIQLHLTNCCFARNIWDHLLLQPEMGGLIWHINLGFVAPRFVPAGNRFFPYHLSYQLCTTGFITCKHLTSSFRCSKASQYISLQSSEIYAVTLLLW